jgi:hypothetical protein
MANRRAFMAQVARSGSEFVIADSYPCLLDRYLPSGTAKGQYFHQDLHVAQMIHAAQPDRHIDVGSRIDGFVAHVATFRPIEVVDIRPQPTTARNITFHQRDIMQPDPTYDQSTESLSCLHTLEHFGLGRYGDPVDFYGYLKGWENLVRMVKMGGTLYVSVPIGEVQRVEFDAHRIFSIPYLLDVMIDPLFEVRTFAYVDDGGDMHHDVEIRSDAAATTWGLSNGCGIFELVRRP